MELETINKLYLELSQIATAKTSKEIVLEKQVAYLKAENEVLRKQVEEHKEWHMTRDEMRKALEAQKNGDSK